MKGLDVAKLKLSIESLSWTKKKILELIKSGIIKDDLTALSRSICKHKMNLETLKLGYYLPDEAFMGKTCPMCQWVDERERRVTNELGVVPALMGIGLPPRCILAEGGRCNGGQNCCGALWKVLYRQKDYLDITIINEQNMIKFMEDKFVTLKAEKMLEEVRREARLKKENEFKEFEVSIKVKTLEEAKVFWSRLNFSNNEVLESGKPIGLTYDEIHKGDNLFNEWFDVIDKILIKQGVTA